MDVKKYVEECDDPWNLKKSGIDERRASFIKKSLSKKGLVLDVGCAFGIYTNFLCSLENKAVGVDFSRQLLDSASLNFNDIDFIQADVTKLPFRDGVFDGALLMGTCIYIKNKSALFSELSRVLKKNGILCIIERNRYSPWHLFSNKLRKETAVDDVSEFMSIDSLKMLVKESSFEIKKISGDVLAVPFFSQNMLTCRMFWSLGEILPSLSYFIVIIAEKKN